MKDYYSEKLSARRLKRCYEIAPPRVRQYLEAEIDHVLQKLCPKDIVLELGCGYGRVLLPLSRKALWVIGVDTSFHSLQLAKGMLHDVSNVHLLAMNAVKLAFSNHIFDMVVCIQNGISAFNVNQRDLIQESIRGTKIGGTVLFSSYSDKFWKHRLEWFKLQSEEGLLGEIDHEKTCDGVIVCKDGFTAITVSSNQFIELTKGFNVETRIVEIDESSLFCELTVI